MEPDAVPPGSLSHRLSSYQLIEQFPTDQGRSVHVAETQARERVLIKRAYDQNWIRDLTEQTRHFLTMHRLLGDQAPYPEVIEYDDGLLIMPFYPHGSLDDLSLGEDNPLVASLTASAIGKLFQISALNPARGMDRQDAAAAAGVFLASQAERRVARLERALAGSAWASQPYDEQYTRGDVLADALAWITDGTLAARGHALGPPHLGLAAHGDFGLNNIMLAQPPTRTAGLVFIDTRGLWIGGLPWWDPVMDLATLLAFHCRIEPAFAAVGGRTSPEVLRADGRLSETEILKLAESDEAAAEWFHQDPRYRERLEVEIAIRLLGSVSVQLLTAHSHGEQRAAAVLDLYLEQAQRVSSILSGRA